MPSGTFILPLIFRIHGKIILGGSYTSWCGFSFELTCLRHQKETARSLGIASIPHQAGTWRHIPTKGSNKTDKGAQIDLLFDRADNVVTLCEVKYTKEPFVIDKSYASDLKNKLEVFQTQTKTKKQLQLVLISANGLKENAWSEDLIDKVITAKELF